MTPGQPDFVFSDEEDGVVAVKNGDEIFYASLYWRARNAVNFLARVHFTTPTMDRIAVVREDAQFTPERTILHAAGLDQRSVSATAARDIRAKCTRRTRAKNCPSPKFPPA